MLITAKSMSYINILKKQLSDEFEIKDLGVAKKILGMEITRHRSVRKLFLSQKAYVEKELKRFNMNNAKPVTISFTIYFKLFVDKSPKNKGGDGAYVQCSLFECYW